MAPQARKTTRTSTARRASTSARKSGEKALKRLHDSVDAAEAALKDVRKEMSRGSKSLLGDVETTLRDARKNLRSVSRKVAKDLEEVQQAAAGKRSKSTSKRSTASAKKAGSTAKRSTASAKKAGSTAKKTTRRKATTKSGARRTTRSGASRK